MKVFLTILFLIFSIQSWTKADDIKDFQIEGMSIGDSLLDYFSAKDIKKIKYNNSNKFLMTNHTSKKFKTYDEVNFHYKSKDRKFIIHELNGAIYYANNIQKCYDKRIEILKELKKIFPNSKIIKQKKSKHPADKTGESTYTYDAFILNDGSIGIECADWGAKMTSKGLTDGLLLFIETNEFSSWISNEAH